VTGPTDDPLKRHGAAFWTFDSCFFIRAKQNLFKEVGALKAPKFKNGHDLLPRLLYLKKNQYKGRRPQSQMKLNLKEDMYPSSLPAIASQLAQARRAGEALLRCGAPQM
jgi:hypothetical protein